SGIMRLLFYCEHLSAGTEQHKDLEFWKKFVIEYFADIGGIKYTVVNSIDKTPKQYEVPNAALPRYYNTLFQDGIRRVQIIPENPREIMMAQEVHVVECIRATMVYWFSNGSHVISHGSLRVFLNATLKIDSLEFHSHDHVEYIPRSLAVAALSTAISSDNTRTNITLPHSQVNGFGITDSLARFLQVTQVMAQMGELVNYYLSQSNLNSPLQTFNKFVSQINAQREVSQQQLQAHMQQ
ncbi:LIM-domain binding protein, partial [Dipodascopsis uninucleata]